MSVTFKIESNARIVEQAVRERVEVALDKLAIDWHAASVKTITDMVYNQPRRGGYRRTGRLRASLAWASPNSPVTHTQRSEDGTIVSYNPPKVQGLQAMVGTNVEYAPAVHDGLGGGEQNVRAHTRVQNGKVVQVRSHTRVMPAREARPFIEQPGIDIAKGAAAFIAREISQ